MSLCVCRCALIRPVPVSGELEAPQTSSRSPVAGPQVLIAPCGDRVPVAAIGVGQESGRRRD